MKRHNARGPLFIMDMHIWPRRPARRTDKDFADTMLSKFEYAMEVARRHDYVPTGAGDIFDRPVVDDDRIKGRILRAGRASNYTWACNLGNHDPSDETLAEKDTLKALSYSGFFEIAETTRVVYVIEHEGKKLAVGMTPYHEAIPTDVTPYIPEDVDIVIWVTHHDLWFDNSYPGGLELHEIKGCNLVINGHMHNRKPMMTKGQTTWFNPGACVRQRLDEAEQTPAVWAFDMERLTLIPFELPHKRDVFDWTGYRVSASGDPEPIDESAADVTTGVAAEKSAFVDIYQVEQATDLPESDDKSAAKELIDRYVDNNALSSATQQIVYGLFNSVRDQPAES